MLNGTEVTALRSGSNLNKKHSDPVVTGVIPDISSVAVRTMYMAMPRIHKFEEGVAEFASQEEII